MVCGAWLSRCRWVRPEATGAGAVPGSELLDRQRRASRRSLAPTSRSGTSLRPSATHVCPDEVVAQADGVAADRPIAADLERGRLGDVGVGGADLIVRPTVAAGARPDTVVEPVVAAQPLPDRIRQRVRRRCRQIAVAPARVVVAVRAARGAEFALPPRNQVAAIIGAASGVLMVAVGPLLFKYFPAADGARSGIPRAGSPGDFGPATARVADGHYQARAQLDDMRSTG